MTVHQEVKALGHVFSLEEGVPLRDGQPIEFKPLQGGYEERRTSIYAGDHIDTLVHIVFVAFDGAYKGIYRYDATDSINRIKSLKKEARTAVMA